MTDSSTAPHTTDAPATGATELLTLASSGGELHVRRDGPRELPALLLLHGTASSVRSWDALVPLLTAHHHVVRLDLPGHGRSAKPADADYALPDQARSAGEVLDRLGIERAVVVGHSSGGVVATALAEGRPGLVDALVLINTGPSLDAFIASPQAAAIGLTAWPPSDAQLREFAGTGFSREGYVFPDELLDDVRGMTLHALTATTGATRAYLAERTLPDRLKDLGVPLLVLFGEDDRRWRSSSAADYRAVEGAEIVMLPGLGHSPLMEDPVRTAAPLLGFTALHAARRD
ncbi:alpha/beta fold hydrolase [Streptomyces sp. NPDC059783]|uniref:alpha/beta fold hydrolase n=1 Tax=Streptomyces sp. NPDC059783 TaxID=3346944 RepID=UPI00366762FD